MAKDIGDLAKSVNLKSGYTATVDPVKGHMSVTKNGVSIVLRVLHNVVNNTVTVGDGSGVKTGDADQWLNELK